MFYSAAYRHPWMRTTAARIGFSALVGALLALLIVVFNVFFAGHPDRLLWGLVACALAGCAAWVWTRRQGLRQAPGAVDDTRPVWSQPVAPAIACGAILPLSLHLPLPVGMFLGFAFGFWAFSASDPFASRSDRGISPSLHTIVDRHDGPTGQVVRVLALSGACDGMMELRLDNLARAAQLSKLDTAHIVEELRRRGEVGVSRDRGTSSNKDSYYVRLIPPQATDSPEAAQVTAASTGQNS